MVNVDYEDAILRTFILFVQTAREVLKHADKHLFREARLSIIRLTVLQVLVRHGGVMSPSKIAEWTQTERHNITALIERMKQDGLVTVERNSSNKRFVDITVTDKGRDVLRQVTPLAREIVEHVMSSITKDEAILLGKLLVTLRNNARTSWKYANKSASLHPA
ncbi:MarR family winged helix-turn-helix transcriptional regulator [Chloroflexota bacterium]